MPPRGESKRRILLSLISTTQSQHYCLITDLWESILKSAFEYIPLPSLFICTLLDKRKLILEFKPFESVPYGGQFQWINQDVSKSETESKNKISYHFKGKNYLILYFKKLRSLALKKKKGGGEGAQLIHLLQCSRVLEVGKVKECFLKSLLDLVQAITCR